MARTCKQYEVLRWAFSFLKKHRREEKVAEILLEHHLNVPRSRLYASMQDDLPDEIVEKFKDDIVAHATTGIPVQHLTGEAYFYGRSFYVNHDVLIPRVETEELVEHVIKLIKKNFPNKRLTVVDVGTGSGVIAITLSLELPNVVVYATDISRDALQVARKNAENLHASVHFLQGDFLQPLIDNDIHPNIIVSNPPYIKESDRGMLSDTVKNFDPHIALFAEDDGLKAYKEIICQLAMFMERETFLCVEIGFDQAQAVTEIINMKFPNSTVDILKDMNRKDRIVIAKINEK